MNNSLGPGVQSLLLVIWYLALGREGPIRQMAGVWIEAASQRAFLQPLSSQGLETESRQHLKKKIIFTRRRFVE